MHTERLTEGEIVGLEHPDDVPADGSGELSRVGEPPAEWFLEALLRGEVAEPTTESTDFDPANRLPHPSRRTSTQGLASTSAGRPAESLVNVGGITPRRSGDDEDSAAVLNLLLAHLPLGVGVVDSGGYVVRANDGLEHLLGCGEAVHLTTLLHPDDRARVSAGLHLLLQGDRGQWRTEARTPIDGLDDRWISLHLIGVASPGQRPGTFMLLVSDVDERLRHHILFDEGLTGRDTITGLLDRDSFEARGREAVNRAAVSDYSIGVLRITSEVTGKPAEDHTGLVTLEVRRETARRLASVLRTTDTVAHLGGGAFGVLAHLACEDPGVGLAAVRSRLTETLLEPIVGNRLLVEPRVCLGSTLAVGRESMDELMGRAAPLVLRD